MGLVSIVKDCWNGIGHVGRVGALTGILLLGGFVSSLYAQEEVPGIKPKDIPKYQKKYEEEKAKKEAKKKADADKKKETPGSGGPDYTDAGKTGGGSDYTDAGKTGGSGRTSSRGDNYGSYGGGNLFKKGINDVLFRLFGTYRVHDRDYNKEDSYLNLISEFVGSDRFYYKLDLGAIKESSRAREFEFQGIVNGFWKDQIEKGHGIGLFLDDFQFGTMRRGGSFGVFYDGPFFDIFLKPKLLHMKDITLEHYDDPTPHEGKKISIVEQLPGGRIGFRIGKDFGLELSGYGDFLRRDVIYEDVPFPIPAGVADYHVEDHSGNIMTMEGSLFWMKEDSFLIKLIGYYFNQDEESVGSYKEKDGTVLVSFDSRHRIYEDRFAGLFVLFPFQSENKNKYNFFSSIDLRAKLDDYEEEYKGIFSFIVQSKGNPMAFLVSKKNADLVSYEKMETVRRIQKFGHNDDSAFFYRVRLGFLSDNPRTNSPNYDRSRYVMAGFDAWVNTKDVNIGGELYFQFDTSSSHHPGKLKVNVGFFGKGYLFVQYEGIFRDFDDFTNKGKATHEISVGAGLNF